MARLCLQASSRWLHLLRIPPNSSETFVSPGKSLWDWIPIIVFICLIHRGPSRDLFDQEGGCRCCFLRISRRLHAVNETKSSVHVGRVNLCVYVWPIIQPHLEHDPSICYFCNWTSCTASVENHFLPDLFFVCLGQSITILRVVIGLGAIFCFSSLKTELHLAAWGVLSKWLFIQILKPTLISYALARSSGNIS